MSLAINTLDDLSKCQLPHRLAEDLNISGTFVYLDMFPAVLTKLEVYIRRITSYGQNE